MNNTIDFKRLQRIVNEEIKRHVKLRESGEKDAPEVDPSELNVRIVSSTHELLAAIKKFEENCSELVGRLNLDAIKKQLSDLNSNPGSYTSRPTQQVNASTELQPPVQESKKRRA